MKILSFVCFLYCLILPAQTYDVDTILYNGNINKMINLVIMAEGYTEEELILFNSDAENLTSYMFSVSPLMEYQNYFNVFAINLPSFESGATHPGTSSDASCSNVPALDVNTILSSSFDMYGIHRLLVPQNTAQINNVLIDNFPLYDQKIVLVNSLYYGGSGGSNATTSLHNSAPEILVHEIGHSFAGLADEYWAGDMYANEKPNLTQQNNPELIKWSNWLGDDGIGIYQHSGSVISENWYRPHNSCKMRYLGYDFCHVCRETIVETIHDIIDTPILSYTPIEDDLFINDSLIFNLELIKPEPNTLHVSWILNGVEMGIENDSITITPYLLNNGLNDLSVELIDTTEFVRDQSHLLNHKYTLSWNINYDSSVYLCGDINVDEQVNSQDAALILQYIVGLIDLEEDQIQNGDVNNDESLNSQDAALILQYIVGLIDDFPECE